MEREAEVEAENVQLRKDVWAGQKLLEKLAEEMQKVQADLATANIVLDEVEAEINNHKNFPLLMENILREILAKRKGGE